MTLTFSFCVSIGDTDLEIADKLRMPFREVLKHLAALPEEEMAKYVKARHQVEKINRPKERFLHGDLGMNPHLADRREQYLCSLCDAFFDEEVHFQKHTREENIERFEFDLEVLAFEAGEGPVIRCGCREYNVIQRTMDAEGQAEYADWIRSMKHG